MRFFIMLWLFMLNGFCAFKSIHASSQVSDPQITELSFSVYLEINGQFIYPARQTAENLESKPFEMLVTVSGLTYQNLMRILLDFCLGNLEIASVRTIRANIDPFLKEGIVMTRVESYMTSSMTSPVESEKLSSFPKPVDLLTLSGDELIQHVCGNLLRVSIESSTDSILTVGHRLRMKELDNVDDKN